MFSILISMEKLFYAKESVILLVRFLAFASMDLSVCDNCAGFHEIGLRGLIYSDKYDEVFMQ